MIENPYTHVTAAEIEPGAWIYHDDQSLVVDEIRRSSDGLTFLCFPGHRPTSGRRVAVLAGAQDNMIVLAWGAVMERLIGSAISELVGTAFDGSAISVSIGDRIWLVPMARAAALPVGAPQAPVPSDPEPAHDDD